MTSATGECEPLAAPAKLNLCLRITGRRADGYHLLDSVVVFTNFGDRLTVRPADRASEIDSLDITGPFAAAIMDEPENICLRAISGYRDAGGVIGPLAVTLDKHIPVGAGLGVVPATPRWSCAIWTGTRRCASTPMPWARWRWRLVPTCLYVSPAQHDI